jgi:transposase
MTDVFDSYIKSRPFKPVFCRKADPESKGKIENVIKYVKQNFLLNRPYGNIDNLNKESESWLNRTGNAMVHNTTEIKPLGTSQTRLMVNIKPNRSTIDVYENLFKTN